MIMTILRGSRDRRGVVPRIAPAALAGVAVLTLAASTPLSGQSPGVRAPTEDERAVLAVMETIFDAMRAADGEALRAQLTDDARLVTTGEREGQAFMSETPASSWVESIAGAEPGQLNETVQDPVVFVDQNLAVIWAPYRFHVGETFRHCGTNVLQLLRTAGGWKVFHLADTRRQEGCDG